MISDRSHHLTPNPWALEADGLKATAGKKKKVSESDRK